MNTNRNKQRTSTGSQTWRGRSLVVVITLLALAAAVPGCKRKKVEAVTYSIGLTSTVRALYPDASWLPEDYGKLYPDLATTITLFTKQSLLRDGVKDPEVTVVINGDEDQVQVTISPANDTTQRYASMHPTFLDGAHASQALKGVNACKAEPGCWKDDEKVPWALFLPLGLPMATQKATLFLDYPPVHAIQHTDYLNNFTMCRWSQVLGAAGATDLDSYQTIVDARPIVAAGSKEARLLPDARTWFDNGTSGGDYLVPMLQLLSNPSGATAFTRPVAVLGGQARETWATMIKSGEQVGVLEAGSSQLGAASPATPWIGGNHPDVASYGCCANDSSCEAEDQTLVEDEPKDFVVACWLMAMSQDNPPDAQTALTTCMQRWMLKVSDGDRQILCVQEKLDDNNVDARCPTWEAAWAFCAAHGADACAQDACTTPTGAPTRLIPALKDRPEGWDLDCNKYRAWQKK